MRVAKIVRQFAHAEVHDVVLAGLGRAIQPGLLAHAIGNGVIGAGRVSAHPQPTDHLPILIECNATAECDNAAGDAANPRSLRLESRIERIGIVQPVKRTGREGFDNISCIVICGCVKE